MNSIDPKILRERLAAGDDCVLIDVREEYEHKEYNIGGLLMPRDSVLENIDRIPKDRPVVFYCAKGIRSGIVVQRLSEKFGYTNLINLTGGMHAWRKETGD